MPPLALIVTVLTLVAMFIVLIYWGATSRHAAEDEDQETDGDEEWDDGEFEERLDELVEAEERLEVLESVVRSWDPIVLAALRVREDDPASVKALVKAVSEAGTSALRRPSR